MAEIHSAPPQIVHPPNFSHYLVVPNHQVHHAQDMELGGFLDAEKWFWRVDEKTGCPVTGQDLLRGGGGRIFVWPDVAAAAVDAHFIVWMPGASCGGISLPPPPLLPLEERRVRRQPPPPWPHLQ